MFYFLFNSLSQGQRKINQNYDVNMDLSLKEQTYPDTIRRPELVASATG